MRAPVSPIKILLLALLGCCSMSFSYAQSKYTVTPFTAGDALVSSEIMALFQDTRSYLWIGHTGGVSRYDGYQFQDFLFTAAQQMGKAYCFAEDPAHNIWIGTENGLFLYTAGQMLYITGDKNTRPIYALASDNAGGLWIGNSDGPAYISANVLQQAIVTRQLPIRRHLLPAWEKRFPLNNPAVFVSLGNDGSAYFGDGYVVYKYWNRQVDPIWRNAGQIDPIKGIVAVNKDTVYISSGQQGLLAIENNIHRRSPTQMGRNSALIEKNGALFCYATEGIYTVNRFTLAADTLFTLPEYMQEWGSCFLQDNEHNFWIATHEQLCYARQNFFTIHRQPALDGFHELYAIGQSNDGTLLCGGNLGATFRADTNSTAFEKWQQFFPRSPVTAIRQEENGDTWISSWYQGIVLLRNGQFRRFTKAEGLRDNSNFIFLENNRGELFTAGDAGVSQIVSDPDGNIRFRNYRFHTGSSDYIVIKSGVPMPGGGLLFGSNRGFLELKKDTLIPVAIKNAQHRSHNITDMRKDAAGNIWISTISDGILLCSFQNDTLVLQEQLTGQQGLPSLVYLQLLIDKDDVVWAAGYHHIARIEKTSNQRFFISTYGKNQGFLPERFHSVKMLQDTAGLIWAATSSGLLSFDPSVVDRNQHPALELSSVTVPGHPQTPENGITLPYSSSSITFRYTGIHFSDPSAVTYTYRLLGLDSSWIDAGNTRQVSFQHLTPGHYTFEVKAAAGTNHWSDTATWQFTITPAFWQRWWFMALCMLAVLAILYLLISIRIKKIRQRAEEKANVQRMITENLQYRLEATEARLKSMRLQMSPHFLFNALNSIQQMILAGDPAVATRCLSKFSRLLRLVLIHSEKEKVTLREELETLQLYIDIESFRFKDRFGYEITCDPAIDPDETKVPVLLIQPFVENAIWHGLLHKEGERRLHIYFSEEENDLLVCTIEDNGIGRQASRAIKERSHTGKGISIAAGRLEVFREFSGHGCSLEITDLEDHKGNAKGTKVVLKFPA